MNDTISKNLSIKILGQQVLKNFRSWMVSIDEENNNKNTKHKTCFVLFLSQACMPFILWAVIKQTK